MIYWTIVSCCSVLLQRGADFNVEDKEGVRADELARQCCAEDCGDAIVRSRQQHMSQLCKLVKQVLVSSVITTDVKRGQNLEAKARATRLRPKPISGGRGQK